MKVLKQNFILFLLLGYSTLSVSQTTFNKYYYVLDYINFPLYIIPDTNTIYCIGYGTNDRPYSSYGIFYASFDLEGNLVSKSFYEEKETKIFGNANLTNAYVVGNKIFFLIGRDELNYEYFITMDKTSGEIKNKLKIVNDFIDGGLIAVKGMDMISDNIFAVGCSITETILEDTVSYWFINPQIALINTELNEVSYIHYGEINKNERIKSIKWMEADFIISDLQTQNRGSEEGYKAQTIINIVDTLGNVQAVFSTDPDSLRGGARDIALGPESSYVFADTKVRQYWIEGWHEYMLIYKPVLFKLDSNYNLEWELEIGGDYIPAYHGYGQVIRVLPAIEGDGYVVMSRMGNKIVPETNQDGDTTSYGEILMYYGIVDRVSESGELLWTRYYSIIHDDIEQNLFNAHKVNDFEYGPDGGYILCGNLNYYQHKVWLLKMDQNGCLIPGCQDTSSTSGYTIPDLPIKVYPNPVSDELYIYQSESNTIRYTVFDMQGNKMTNFTGNHEGETLILRTTDYPPGTYVLHAETEDGKRGLKRFVKLDY